MKLRLYGPNLIINPGFETGVSSGWSFYVRPGSADAALSVASVTNAYTGSYAAFIDITTPGLNVSDIQFYQQSIRLPGKVRSAIQFAGKADSNRQISPSIILAVAPYSSYFYAVASLTTAYQLIEHTFQLPFTVGSGRIDFYCGSGTASVDFYLDDINLRNYIELPVTYGYERAEVLTRHDARGAAGALTTYIEPNAYGRFTLPLVHVDSAARSLINSWWTTGSELRLVEDSTYPFSWRSVRITGTEEPITKFMRPYNSEYEGELVLETV